MTSNNITIENIIQEQINEYHSVKGALIPILQKVQEQEGYLSTDAMKELAKKLKMPVSEIYGVATFYTQFRFKPMGKHIIKICHGTACHVNGAKNLDTLIKTKLGIDIGDSTDDGLFSVLSVSCLGCCSLAPAVMIDDKTYGNLDQNKFSKIIDEYSAKEHSTKK